MSSEPVKAGGMTAAQRDKLARILGMLGSDHAGERAAAALLADKMVRGRGVEWVDVLRQPRNALPDDWRGLVRRCLGYPEVTSIADDGFLRGMLRTAGPPSPRQARWIADISKRIRERGGEV